MAAFKNKDNGTWYVQFRYTDWKGERQQKLKRGFATKREALEWEREFLMEKQADVNMTFESFVALYEKDIKPKLKLNTWLTKESIIKKKILPYFANRKLSEITAKDIIRWQNEIRELRDCHGKPLSKTYLKTVHNQLSAIFNHAARFYGLNINPARQAGNMGAEERKEMLFWTREEYTRFSEAMMDKPLSFYAFEVLYWCGVREGELLALTPADFDFEKRTVTINKSYQRLNGQDLITTPKTERAIVSSLCRSFWQRKFRITSKCSTELEQMTECLPSPSVISIGRWIEAPKRPESRASESTIFVTARFRFSSTWGSLPQPSRTGWDMRASTSLTIMHTCFRPSKRKWQID